VAHDEEESRTRDDLVNFTRMENVVRMCSDISSGDARAVAGHEVVDEPDRARQEQLVEIVVPVGNVLGIAAPEELDVEPEFFVVPLIGRWPQVWVAREGVP